MTEVYEWELNSTEQVREFVEFALSGELSEGIYELDVSGVEEDMAYPEERELPGYTAPHSRSDLECHVRISEDRINQNAEELAEYLQERGLDHEEFLGHVGYGITSKRGEEKVVSRACRFQD